MLSPQCNEPVSTGGFAVPYNLFGQSLLLTVADVSTRNMFEPFSDGYYVGRLYVEPHDEPHASINRHMHEEVNKQIYATGTGVERLDHPLVMKVDRQHFAVHGSDAIPEETLAIPSTFLEADSICGIPELREVLLAKADRAAQLLRLFGVSDEPAGI